MQDLLFEAFKAGLNSASVSDLDSYPYYDSMPLKLQEHYKERFEEWKAKERETTPEVSMKQRVIDLPEDLLLFIFTAGFSWGVVDFRNLLEKIGDSDINSEEDKKIFNQMVKDACDVWRKV